MTSKLLTTILYLVFLCQQAFTNNGEPVFTDYSPEYKKWKDVYILDKITYTDTRTVFHFRFIDHDGGAASFYGPGGTFAWFLKNASNGAEAFDLIEIRNIRINDILKRKVLNSATFVEYISNPGDVFSCEVHFPRLPNHVSIIHFIEGKGREMFENHFNCFNVKLKTFDSEDLGTAEEMEEKIEKFEEQKEAIFADRFLELVNQLRAEGCYCGSVARRTAPPVSWEPQLAKASKGFVEEMWELNTMLSTDTSGRSTMDRVHDLKMYPKKAYENISYGFEDIEEAFRGWKDSPQQCLRIMNPNVRAIGASRKGKYWSMVLITD